MNSTTSNDAMPEAAPQPEMPIVEPRERLETLEKTMEKILDLPANDYGERTIPPGFLNEAREAMRPVQQETDTSDRLRSMHPGAELGWTDGGGMVEQQAAASKWVEAASEERAAMQESPAAEMTDSRQAAQYSRWTGEPLGETAGVEQSAGIGQSH